MNVSYKPQKISPKFKVGHLHTVLSSLSSSCVQVPHTDETTIRNIPTHLFPQGSVRALLHDKIRDAYTHPQFVTDVMKPLQMDSIIDQAVSLS